MTKSYKKFKKDVYIAEGNFVRKADEFFIAVAIDANGNEGVVAEIDFNRHPLIEKPLMGVSIADRDAIIKSAQRASNQSEMKIRILRYKVSDVICEIVPEKLN